MMYLSTRPSTRLSTIATALVLATAPARAEPNPRAQAKQHFKQAKALQDAGKYDDAVAEYRAAYDLDQRPEMLFNIAQVYRLGNHKQLAVDYYQQYLAAQPDGSGAREARQWIAELTRQIEADRPLPSEPEKPAPPPTAPPPSPPSRSEPEPPALTATRGSPQLRIAGLATAGAGAIALGFGVVFGIKARSAADTITNHQGPWTEDERHTFEDGQRANRTMIIGYVAGGALVVTGGVLYYLGARTHVVPIADARTAGLAVQGRF
jgi:tetratricopeptide (TPR) repeat protein